MNKVLKNASWIIGCKIVQSMLNLVISMISARYLGPSNYGLINYASSVIAFVVPIMQLGFTKTIIQEFIERPDEEGKTLGTAYVFNMISALACMVGVYAFFNIANVGETETIIVGVLYSISLLFNATEIVNYWFQAKLMSKYPSITSLIAYVVVAGYKIFLLVTGKSVRWFAVSNSIDYLVVSVILLVIYNKFSTQKLGFSFKIGKKMLSRSKHYIVSCMMVTVFAQTDKIMLKMMIDETQVGFYSSAVVCAGVTAFIFTAIEDSMRPTILEAKSGDPKIYEHRMITLYSVVTWLSLAQSLVMTILAKPLVLLLYGSAYLEAVNPLRIVVWYTTFSYYGTVRNIWILAEGKQKYLWIINLSGALANVALNAILIPICGTIGAAIASLFTQFFTNVFIGFIMKPIRYNNTLMLKGLNPAPLIGFTKSTISSIQSKLHSK